MTKVNLPRLNQTGANEWSDVEANDVALQEVINGNIDNENIKAEAGISRSKLEAAARGVAGTWYTPKVIATEQSRESTSFGTLSTADQIASVVLPENGLIFVAYQATAKSSVSGAGRAAIYLGENQLRGGYGSAWNPGTTTLAAQEATITTTEWVSLGSSQGGLVNAVANGWASDYSTGQVVGSAADPSGLHGPCCIFAAAGTYTISVRFRATSGSITAKNRKLWVWTAGV